MLPAHKARQATRGHSLEAAVDRTGPGEFEHLHRLRQPLHRELAQRLHLDQPIDEAEGGRRQPDTARGRQLFHARGEVRGLPHSRVVHVQVITDGPHHHLAGVQADAHVHLQAVRAADLFAVAPQRGLHGQGRVAGPQGVILMRQRGAKEGHNAIAQHLVHRALVAVHGLHHVMQGGVEELPGSLRIEVGNQLGGAFEVSKEDGDLLALAFKHAAGRQNFLGQVLGGVGERLTCLACLRYRAG